MVIGTRAECVAPRQHITPVGSLSSMMGTLALSLYVKEGEKCVADALPSL